MPHFSITRTRDLVCVDVGLLGCNDTLKMEAVGFSEMLISTYKSTWYCSLENYHRLFRLLENLKSHERRNLVFVFGFQKSVIFILYNLHHKLSE
jgi:hypothetical protein